MKSCKIKTFTSSIKQIRLSKNNLCRDQDDNTRLQPLFIPGKIQYNSFHSLKLRKYKQHKMIISSNLSIEIKRIWISWNIYLICIDTTCNTTIDSKILAIWKTTTQLAKNVTYDIKILISIRLYVILIYLKKLAYIPISYAIKSN